MLSTTTYSRADVVLVEFPFTDLSGRMKRPAVVVSDDAFNQVSQDVIVAQITTRVNANRFGDHVINHWQQAGLLAPSVARAKLATLATSKITRTLGQMPKADMTFIDGNIRTVLGL